MDETQTVLAQLVTLLTPGRLVAAATVLLSAWLLSYSLQWLLQRWANRATAYRMRILRVVPPLRVALWLVAIWIVVIPIFQPPEKVVMALMGGSAIAVGLALQDTLKNLLGGLTLLIDRPFQVGDKVSLDGHFGEVVAIGLRSVRLVTNDDNMIVVPASRITTDSLDNSNAGNSDFQVVAELFLREPCDLARVERLAWEAAVSSPFVYLEKPVSIRMTERLAQQPVTCVRIKAYVIDVRLETRFHSDIVKRAKAAFTKAGLV